MPPDAGAAREKAQRIAQEATERLVAELSAGRSQALREYLAAMGRFHRYSWTNTLLIHSQRPTATRVAGYHAWRDLGRSVRRGEKGLVIYAPIVTKAKDAERSPLPAEKAAEPHRPMGFRAAYVFDIEQTEGKPLPAPSVTQGNPGEFLGRLKEVVAARGIELTYDASIAPADGLSIGGRIKVRPGLAPAEEFSVLAHELAHEMLHRGSNRSELSKTVRETQAEAVAYVVSRGINLETNTAASDYIALYRGDAKTLTESLALIQEASSRILKELLPDERLPAAPENAFDAHPHPASAPQPTGEAPSHSQAPAPPTSEPGDSISWDR